MSTILITGAAGKLGQEITSHLLSLGHAVIATSRRAEALDELRNGVAPHGERLHGLVCDLSRDGGSGLVRQLAATGLLPDAVVNNAVDIANQSMAASGHPTREQWLAEFQLAVVAPYDIVTGLAELDNTPLQAVVNISSMYGVVARTPWLYDDPTAQSPIHYGVAKAAMIHLTKELAVRLAPRIRVNSISYGGVEGRVDEAFKQRYARLCPMGRMLHDDEVAAPIAFLLSKDASMMTGHNLVFDGGWTIW